MNLFSLASLSLGVGCVFLALVVFRHAKENLHLIWAWFNVAVGVWGLGSFLAGISGTNYIQALYSWKLAYAAGFFVATLFYHVVYEFCEIPKKQLLIFAYLQSLVSLLLIFTSDSFIGPLTYRFNAFYYTTATPVYSIWLITWSSIVVTAFVRLFRFIIRSAGVARQQGLYLFVGMLLGFTGGCSTLLLSYGILLYPVWQFSVCIYIVIVTYAILKHQFLNVKIVLTRSILPVVLCALILSVYCFVYFKFNLFSAAGFSLSVLCLVLAFVVFAYAAQKVHHIWSIFNVIVAFWGMGTCLAGMSAFPADAIFKWRLTYLPCTFISIVFYHLVCEFCGLNRRKTLAFAYIQGILFLPFIAFSRYYVGSTIFVFNSIHYHKATVLFTFWLFVWGIITFLAFYELYIFLKGSKGIKKKQASYLFWGMLLGFTGGTTTVIPAYNIPVYPVWHFAICIYAGISTYAIFRYQIMDIKIAITRLGIFVLVYSMVLGIPFGMAIWGRQWLTGLMGENWFWAPMVSLLMLATAGPFIYLYFQSRAENMLQEEEKRLRELLTNASVGMRNVRDVRKLFELIVKILANSLQLDDAAIYLQDAESNRYVRKVSRQGGAAGADIEKDNPLIRMLEETKYPIVYEEVKISAESRNREGDTQAVAGQMAELRAGVVIPAIVEDSLLGFIALGERKDKGVYSAGLINVLSVVGNQAALAIENAVFYEEAGKDLAQRFQDSRLKSLGTVGTGVAHQMHNRFAVITLAGEYIIRAIRDIDFATASREELVKIKGMIISHIDKIVKSAFQGADITEAIKNYAKKADAKPSVVTFGEAVKTSMDLALLKQHKFRFKFVEDYPKDALLWVNFTNLQEVIFNAADNSCDAMAVKWNKIKAADPASRAYEPCITIRGRAGDGRFTFEIEDNGIGFDEEHLKKGVDVPFFTTKGAQKGTGMGLHMMAQYIRHSNGEFRIESKRGEFARLIITLPLATPEQVAAAKAAAKPDARPPDGQNNDNRLTEGETDGGI